MLEQAFADNHDRGAGADTVSVAMRSALYYLGVHPDMLRKVQAEVDSLDTTEPITYKQTQQLPYLKAVVRESLRMYPSIPAQLYRFVPEQGMAVDDRYIPAGTVVGMSGLAQNRDELVFGSDVDVFKPERWLGDAEEQRRLEASLFNFGGNGPRSCPGRDLAMVGVQNNLLVQLADFPRLSCTNSLLKWFRNLIFDFWTKSILSKLGHISSPFNRTCG